MAQINNDSGVFLTFRRTSNTRIRFFLFRSYATDLVRAGTRTTKIPRLQNTRVNDPIIINSQRPNIVYRTSNGLGAKTPITGNSSEKKMITIFMKYNFTITDYIRFYFELIVGNIEKKNSIILTCKL